MQPLRPEFVLDGINSFSCFDAVGWAAGNCVVGCWCGCLGRGADGLRGIGSPNA